MSDTQKNLYKKLLGFSGEGKAIRHLKRNGYKILEKNYVCKAGEADILCEKDGVIVFVEVKTRINEKYGRPCEAVTTRKQQKYRMIARCFLASNNLDDIPIRFDVIEILGKELNHIENAF